jgi:hypothetical protein
VCWELLVEMQYFDEFHPSSLGDWKVVSAKAQKCTKASEPIDPIVCGEKTKDP